MLDSRSMNHLPRTLCLLVLIAPGMLAGCGPATSPASNSETEVAETEQSVRTQETSSVIPVPQERQVVVVVDAPDGTVIQVVEDVEPGSTLESVLRKATELEMVITGASETAFVHQIAGVETGFREGWTYEVDGEFAKVGIGQYELQPPTVVRWTYGTMKESE